MSNKDSLLKARIDEIFDTDLENRADFTKKVSELIAEVKDASEVYQCILFLFSHVEFSKEDAKLHWERILLHRDELSQKIGRKVVFRVALLDYLLTKLHLYKNPQVLELYIYENAKYNVTLDELTGLYNHRFLREYLWKETKRSLRYEKKFSLLVVDIDDFKDINDRYGQLTGDEVLKSVSKSLETNMRIEDVATRYSGDEFIVLLPETDKKGALVFASRIKRLMENVDANYGTIDLSIKVSVGVATFGEDSKDAVELMEMADKALYRANSWERTASWAIRPIKWIESSNGKGRPEGCAWRPRS
jgi:diguanylate cyclase (GGDEF)-like protein